MWAEYYFFMKTHGDCGKRLNRIWHCMKQRTNNKNHEAYYRYGGKGIKICDEWSNSYVAFKNWASKNGYRPNLTLDRIENSKGYYPENCKWSTPKQQANNRTNNVIYTYKGITKTLEQWADEYKIDKLLVWKRVHRQGYTIEQALTYKKHYGTVKRWQKYRKTNNLLTFKGETHCLAEWAKIVKINRNALYSRLTAGWTIEEILTCPQLRF